MNLTEFLVTCSSIGVAFAGFAGIVAVIGARATGGWRPADVVRFWQMIEVALMASLIPLVPFLYAALELSDATVWAASSLTLAAVQVLHMARAVWRTVVVGRADATVSLGFTLPYTIIATIIAGVLVLNATGIVYRHSPGPFLVGVFWQVSLAAVLFWRLLKFSDIPYGPEETRD